MFFFSPEANVAYLNERNLQSTYWATFPTRCKVFSDALIYKLTVKLCANDRPEDCRIEVDADSFLKVCLCKQGFYGITTEVSEFESILPWVPMEWTYLNGNISRSLTTKEFFNLFRSENEEFHGDEIELNDSISIYRFSFNWFPYGNFPWQNIDWEMTGQRCLPIIEEFITQFMPITKNWLTKWNYRND